MASELGLLVEEVAATAVGVVSSVGLTAVAGRGGLRKRRDKRRVWHPGLTR